MIVRRNKRNPKRWPFEVRSINERERLLRYVEDFQLFHDAVIAADFARELVPECHFVVWDADAEQVVYDTRKTPSRSSSARQTPTPHGS